MPVAAAALRDRQGLWLMHRRALHRHHGGLWEFPGGKVEPGETPAQTLVREIAEELGVALDPGRLRPAGFADGALLPVPEHAVILLYTCDRWRGEPQALEGEELGWFTPAEMAGLAMPPLDRVLLEQLAKSLPIGDCQAR